MTDATRTAAAGRTHDLTQGPITRTLLMFALPTLGSNVLQSLNGSINSIWVGRFLGEGALAATTNANLVMFLMFSLCFGFGMAATILVGQSMGARDLTAARRAMGTAMGLFGVSSILIAVLGWLFAPALLHVLATPPDAQALALAYLRVIFLALPPLFLGVLLSMGLRGTGDSMTPLWLMGLSVLLDAGLNPFLIAGIGPFPRMGIAGSAMSTLVGNYVALIGLLIYMYAKDLPLRLRGRELCYLWPNFTILKTIVTKGLPMGIQMVVISMSALALVSLVNREGVDTTAAFGVAMQLWTYVQMPAMALGAAVSAMTAQNIGAGRWDRVNAITRSGVIYALLITGALIVLLTLADRSVLALFMGGDSPALPIARHIHMLATWNFLLFGVTMVLFGTVRANGAVWAPLIILAVGLVAVRFGWILATYGWLGADALWSSFPVASAANMLLAVAYYFKGGWRKARMAVQPSVDECIEEAEATREPGGALNPAG